MALACQAACAPARECCHRRSGQQDGTRYLGDDEIRRDLRSASAHAPLKPIWFAEDIQQASADAKDFLNEMA